MYFNEATYSGLPTKFEKFRQKIALTDNQRDKIKTSHKHLREKILQPLDYISHTFLTGSYKKKTLINPANDIDVFVVLKGYTQHNVKPNIILDKLEKDLNITCPVSQRYTSFQKVISLNILGKILNISGLILNQLSTASNGVLTFNSFLKLPCLLLKL